MSRIALVSPLREAAGLQGQKSVWLENVIILALQQNVDLTEAGFFLVAMTYLLYSSEVIFQKFRGQ